MTSDSMTDHQARLNEVREGLAAEFSQAASAEGSSRRRWLIVGLLAGLLLIPGTFAAAQILDDEPAPEPVISQDALDEARAVYDQVIGPCRAREEAGLELGACERILDGDFLGAPPHSPGD